MAKEVKKETKKEAPKKAAPKKVEAKKEAPKKEAPKKAAPKKEEPKKAAPKKVEPKKEAPKKVEEKEEISNKIYHISKRKEDGMWQVKFANGVKAIKLFNTQAEAIVFAKKLAKSQDGSIRVHSLKGRIRKSN